MPSFEQLLNQWSHLSPMLGAVGGSLPYLCLAITAVMVGALLLVTRRLVARRGRQPVRRAVDFDQRMAELGMHHDGDGWDGQLGGRRVRVVRYEDRKADPPTGLEISTVVPTGQLRVTMSDPELTAIRGSRHIGDAEFDPWFEVEGDLEDIALLTAEVRRAMRNVAKHIRPRIERGWVTVTGPGNADIDTRFAPLVAVASALETAATEPNARIRKFAGDPDSGVRIRCLEMLSSRPASSLSSAVARDRLDDDEPVVRTLAAVLARDSARLVTIAQSADQAAAVRRRAARALMQTGTKDEQMAAATALAAGPPPLHSLAYELCEPLGEDAEPVLITLVASPNDEVARGAAGMLGKVGSIRAIPALREFQSRTGELGPLRPELAKAIKAVSSSMASGMSGPSSLSSPGRHPRSIPPAPSPKADEPTRELPPRGRRGPDEAWLDDVALEDEPPAGGGRRSPSGRTIKRGKR